VCPARLERLAGELAAQEELLEQLLTHLTAQGARIGALREGLGRCGAGARGLRGKVARQGGRLRRSERGVLGALEARREELDRLRRRLSGQEERVVMIRRAVRDSLGLERALARRLP
jgi:hypothetical protein